MSTVYANTLPKTVISVKSVRTTWVKLPMGPVSMLLLNGASSAQALHPAISIKLQNQRVAPMDRTTDKTGIKRILVKVKHTEINVVFDVRQYNLERILEV
ncbi:hypothetical protein KIM372_14080 [Bombiscardovia nodaiensis]|uniref:Uncharacterized protein n=1 Tax=Bombiscardovia nodaiensis TaxID=2932181 RepID=A0ABM8B9D6_9BIFI|nr:hypothetical protein KIM372_14080 [Bombiscardovia nodaiensis]